MRSVGTESLLMVDANQALSVQEALIRGRVFEEMGCFWFEEPIRATISMARPPGARATIPSHRREYLRTGAVPPAVRAAGRRYRAAGYPARGRTHRVPRNRPTAKSFDIPTASHGGCALLHVLAALPYAIYLESGLLGEGSESSSWMAATRFPKSPGLG